MASENALRDGNHIPVLMLEKDDGSGEVMMARCDANGRLKATATLPAGSGDVVGPSGATDGAIAAFDTATGKLLKDTKVVMTPVATGATITVTDGKTLQVTNNATVSGTNTGDEVAAQAVGFTITKGTTPKTLTVPLDASVSGTNTGDEVAAQAIGFTITKGTTPKTLTVPLDASVSGTNTGDQTNITGNAGTVTVANEASDTTCFPLFSTAATGSMEPKTNAGLTFDASTGTHSATIAKGGSVQVVGTAGAGFLDLPHQSSNPTSPAAGIARIHGSTVNGYTRPQLDNEAATNLTITRDEVFICQNNSGGSITKGSAVYVNGTASGVPTIGKARANSLTTLPALGIVMDTVADNGFCQVMRMGIITNIDTSAFSSNDVVYISTATAGALQNTRPSGANYVQKVGKVLVQNATTGSILIDLTPFIGNMETGTASTTYQFAGTFDLGGATDATVSRTGAGTIAVEGVEVTLNTATQTLTNKTIGDGTNAMTLTLAEKASIGIDPSIGTDHNWCGTTVTGTIGETIALGDLVSLHTDGKYYKTDANTAAASSGDARRLLRMTVVGGNADATGTFLMSGSVLRDDSWTAMAVGAPIYVSETAGAITATQPTTTDAVIRIVGHARSAQVLEFNPDNTWTTHV